jgi:hypothetical protein
MNRCWSCGEPYDDSLVKCPQCGAPKENPRIPEPEPEPKRSHKVKDLIDKITPGRK